MNSFLFVVCLVPMVLAGMWGDDNMGSLEKKEDGMMSEYEKWQMKDKKDQMTYLHKFQEFLLFKDKLQKMKEMEHKKVVFEEFMKWKMNKMGEKKNEEQDDTDSQMKKEESGDFGVVLKKMASDAHKNAMMITHAFLALCKCQNEMGIEKMFNSKEEMGSNDNKMGDMFEGEMPDFMGNMTAKAEFLKTLSKEEQKKMFGYGLVKSMCNGAKTFIVHAKEFEVTYMKN